MFNEQKKIRESKMNKEEQLKTLENIFSSKEFDKQVTFFKEEFKQITEDFVNVFDIDDDNVLAVKRVCVKPFRKAEEEREGYYGFYDYYPFLFDGRVVNRSKISVRQTGMLEKEFDGNVDLSVLEKEVDLSEQGEKEKHSDICRALAHEIGHFLSRKQFAVLNSVGEPIDIRDVGTFRAKGGKVLIFTGGTEHGYVDLDEKGDPVVLDDVNAKLEEYFNQNIEKQTTQIEENSDDLEEPSEEMLKEIEEFFGVNLDDGKFDENSIGAKLLEGQSEVKEENDFFEEKDFGNDFQNMYNGKTVYVNPPCNTIFGKFSNKFHEGMTEFFAQKLVQKGSAPCLQEVRENKALFDKLKTYPIETSFVSMIDALEPGVLEKIYFQGKGFQNFKVLGFEIIDDFVQIQNAFEKVQEVLSDNGVICDELRFLNELEQSKGLGKEDLEGKKELETNLKQNEEEFLKEFKGFCKETKAILKREQKQVKKALDEGQVSVAQVKKFFSARNGLLSVSNWRDESCFLNGFEFKSAEEIMAKYLGGFFVDFEQNENNQKKTQNENKLIKEKTWEN